jgi:hypothetical protein
VKGLEDATFGLPGLYDLILAETSTVQPGEEAVVRDLVQYVVKTNQRIMRVCPWPLPVNYIKGDPQIMFAPPLSPKSWNEAVSI